MSRTRWNLLIAALLLGNLLRWSDGFGPLFAHPVDDGLPPAVPDSIITAADEEWEAMEVAGTNPDDLSFMVVPCKHVAGPGGPVQLDKLGCAVVRTAGGPGKGKDDDDDDKAGKDSAIAMSSTLVVTKWRVKGHMHRVRGRP